MMERVAAFAITGTGGADGYFTVSSVTGAWPGQEGNLTLADGSGSRRVRCTDLLGATKIGLQFIPQGMDDPKLATGEVKHPSYTRNDISAFLVGAKLYLETGLVPVKGNGNPVDSIWT